MKIEEEDQQGHSKGFEEEPFSLPAMFQECPCATLAGPAVEAVKSEAITDTVDPKKEICATLVQEKQVPTTSERIAEERPQEPLASATQITYEDYCRTSLKDLAKGGPSIEKCAALDERPQEPLASATQITYEDYCRTSLKDLAKGGPSIEKCAALDERILSAIGSKPVDDSGKEVTESTLPTPEAVTTTTEEEQVPVQTGTYAALGAPILPGIDDSGNEVTESTVPTSEAVTALDDAVVEPTSDQNAVEEPIPSTPEAGSVPAQEERKSSVTEPISPTTGDGITPPQADQGEEVKEPIAIQLMVSLTINSSAQVVKVPETAPSTEVFTTPTTTEEVQETSTEDATIPAVGDQVNVTSEDVPTPTAVDQDTKVVEYHDSSPEVVAPPTQAEQRSSLAAEAATIEEPTIVTEVEEQVTALAEPIPVTPEEVPTSAQIDQDTVVVEATTVTPEEVPTSAQIDQDTDVTPESVPFSTHIDQDTIVVEQIASSSEVVTSPTQAEETTEEPTNEGKEQVDALTEPVTSATEAITTSEPTQGPKNASQDELECEEYAKKALGIDKECESLLKGEKVAALPLSATPQVYKKDSCDELKPSSKVKETSAEKCKDSDAASLSVSPSKKLIVRTSESIDAIDCSKYATEPTNAITLDDYPLTIQMIMNFRRNSKLGDVPCICDCHHCTCGPAKKTQDNTNFQDLFKKCTERKDKIKAQEIENERKQANEMKCFPCVPCKEQNEGNLEICLPCIPCFCCYHRCTCEELKTGSDGIKKEKESEPKKENPPEKESVPKEDKQEAERDNSNISTEQEDKQVPSSGNDEQRGSKRLSNASNTKAATRSSKDLSRSSIGGSIKNAVRSSIDRQQSGEDINRSNRSPRISQDIKRSSIADTQSIQEKTRSSISFRSQSSQSKTRSSISDRPRSSQDKTRSSISVSSKSSQNKTRSSISDRPRSSQDKTRSSISDRPRSSQDNARNSISDRPRSSQDKTRSSISDRPRSSQDKTRSSITSKDIQEIMEEEDNEA